MIYPWVKLEIERFVLLAQVLIINIAKVSISNLFFSPFSTALSFKSLQFYDTEISTRMNLAFMNKEDILYCYYLAKSYKIINPAKA